MVATPATAVGARSGDDGFYVDDVAFAGGVVAEQSPLVMAVAAALGGFRPPSISSTFRYCDLGCGDGTTVCALAAVNPAASFVGIDFNPLHVEQGRRIAEQLGLANVHFVQASFTELHQHSELGSFDLVAMNGIYAWLEEQPRQAAMAFVQQHLADGGLFYVESTTLPGMAAVPPLWHLIQTLVPAEGRSSRQRAEEGLNLLDTLAKRGLAFLAANPRAAGAARHYLGQRKSNPEAALDHFIHNAMASGFRPRYFDAMAAEMAAAGLQFAGRTALGLNLIELAVPPGQVPTLRDVTDPVQRQLLIDYIRNEQNRRDIYIKAATPHPEAATAFLTHELRLLGRNSPETLQRQIPVIGGHGVPLRGPLYDALLPAFEAGPLSSAEVSLPDNTSGEQLARATQMLISSDQFALCLPGATLPAAGPGVLPEQPQLVHAVNRHLLAQAVNKLQATTLVSPLTGGSGIHLSPLEASLLDAASNHGWDEAASSVHQRLSQLTTPLPSARGPIAANRVRLEDLQQLVSLLRGRKASNLQRLGMLA